jgi:hypothetical protein
VNARRGGGGLPATAARLSARHPAPCAHPQRRWLGLWAARPCAGFVGGKQ